MNKRQLSYVKMTKWDQAIRTLILRNQGYTFEKIGQELELSRQRVHQLYKKYSNKTISELEEYQQLSERTK